MNLGSSITISSNHEKLDCQWIRRTVMLNKNHTPQTENKTQTEIIDKLKVLYSREWQIGILLSKYHILSFCHKAFSAFWLWFPLVTRLTGSYSSLRDWWTVVCKRHVIGNFVGLILSLKILSLNKQRLGWRVIIT